MTQQILIIHGGNVFETYDDYLIYLKTKKVTLDDLKFKSWRENIQDKLGNNYEVFNPLMPLHKNAKYNEWKIWFEKIVPLLNDDIILIGHSLGGIFLAKYLTENNFPKKIKALFLVAAPFEDTEKETLGDFKLEKEIDLLSKKISKIYIYQSTDDQTVPYSHAKKYLDCLPNAIFKEFTNHGHFHQSDLPEIVNDILALKQF